MKNVCFLVFLLFFNLIYGIYNGNPSEPDMPELGIHISNENWWGIKVGYLLDHTFWKKVDFSDPQTVEALGIEQLINDISASCQFQKNSAVLTFNIIDRVELFTHLGSMNMTFKSFLKDSTSVLYKAKDQFFWGVGGRIILVYWAEVVMGVNALYQNSLLNSDSLSVNQKPLSSKGPSFRYKEWQLGISFSREVGMCIPYVGLAYASMDSSLHNLPKAPIMKHNLANQTIGNSEPFILYLGVGLTNGQLFAINIESRLIGEQAISFFANLRF